MSQRLPVIDLFWRATPRAFARSFSSGLCRCYREAGETIERVLPGWAGFEARPHLQRGLVEQMMEFEARKHPEMLRASVEANRTRTSKHVEVHAGKVVVTAHFVRDSTSSARKAEHRIDLSHHTQVEMFEPVKLPADAKLYAQILHGYVREPGKSRATDQSPPDFAFIRFPSVIVSRTRSLTLTLLPSSQRCSVASVLPISPTCRMPRTRSCWTGKKREVSQDEAVNARLCGAKT